MKRPDFKSELKYNEKYVPKIQSKKETSPGNGGYEGSKALLNPSEFLSAPEGQLQTSRDHRAA